MQSKGYVKHVEYKFLLDTAHFVFEHEKIKKLFLTFQGLIMTVEIEVLSEQIWYIEKKELL